MSINSFTEIDEPEIQAGSWLCETEADRERMLDMESRIRPVRGVTMGLLALALALCGPWVGFWALAPLAGAAAAFVLAERATPKTRFPEYAMMSAWVGSQVAIGLGIALSGGPESPALALIAVPIVSLSARFSARGVAFGVLVSVSILALATVAVDTRALLDDPTYTILAAAVVICVGVLSTALMHSDVQYRSEAVLDPLTGMLNRKALQSRADELEQQSKIVNQPIGMIVADIDRFKRVNDELGHAMGDAVLTDIAYLMRKELRAFDLAYRIGGEEFVILLPGATLDQAALVAEDLRSTVAGASVAGGMEITVSLGVGATRAGDTFDYERAFAEADGALLMAKQEGRNRICRTDSRVGGLALAN